MSDYIYIDNLKNRGKIAISHLAFESLVSDAIKNVPGISKSSKQLKKNQRFKLNRPVRVNIKNDVAHIWLAIDVDEKVDPATVIEDLESEIHSAMDMTTEQAPYDIEVKVDTIKNESKTKKKK